MHGNGELYNPEDMEARAMVHVGGGKNDPREHYYTPLEVIPHPDFAINLKSYSNHIFKICFITS